MPSALIAAIVAVAYIALAKLSAMLTHEATDAWSVWLATPLTLGALLVVARPRWLPVLAGAAIGAAIFSWVLDPGRIAWAGGYAVIEVAPRLPAPGLRIRSHRSHFRWNGRARSRRSSSARR